MAKKSFLSEFIAGCRNAFADIYSRRFVNDNLTDNTADLITAITLLALSVTIFLTGPVLIPVVGLCVLTTERFKAWKLKRTKLKEKNNEQPTVYP